MANASNPEKIGRYKVIDRVGKGGMGVLYRGIDPVLDREVAIKVMLVDFSDDSEQMRPRFYREARASAKLQHPNIVTVFEFAEEENTPYIVMEFLRGTSLAQRMSSPVPLTLVEKVDIVAQLCAALGYAHEQGVVHRDVKPANIFLLNDGSVKLLDFGIAKVTSSTLTREGDVLGSASYMSPEQVSGSDGVDGRTDVFSAGVVLYELLAGKKPFHSEQPTGIIMKILHEDPPPLDQAVPGLPTQLVAAVNKSIAKKPADRFATATEFAKELQWIRKALQAVSEGAEQQMDETRFANPSEIRRFQQALDATRTPGSAMPAAGGDSPTGTRAGGIILETPEPKKWLIPAGIAAAVVVIGVVGFVMSRGGPEAPAAPPSSAAAPGTSTTPEPSTPGTPPPTSPGAPSTPAAPEFTLQVTTTPPGAAITLNGRETNQTTPAAVAMSGEGPHKLSLSRRGSVSQEVEIGAADLKRGSVSYTLAAVEPTLIPVSIASTYPVEVVSGGRVTSAASESHTLRLAVGSTVRVRSSEYLLDATVRVDGRQVEYQAPALGYLSVLTTFETCTIRIGQRDLGYPPISRLPIAAGQHRLDFVCPDGQAPQARTVTVAANETVTARIQ